MFSIFLSVSSQLVKRLFQFVEGVFELFVSHLERGPVKHDLRKSRCSYVIHLQACRSFDYVPYSGLAVMPYS